MISRVCYCFRLSRVSYSLYCNKVSVHNMDIQKLKYAAAYFAYTQARPCFQKNEYFWVGSESPCRAELSSADLDLNSLFFQIHPQWRFFINNFYLKSSHRLKSIIGTIIILVNNNNFDFIAILLLAGGLKATAE